MVVRTGGERQRFLPTDVSRPLPGFAWPRKKTQYPLAIGKTGTLQRMTAIIARFALFAILWVALAGAAKGALWFGVPAAFAATVLSVRLYPGGPRGLRLSRAALLLPSLLVRGLVSGFDVARRALDPRLPVAPDWVRANAPAGPDELRVLLGGVISVLPGTLAAAPSGTSLDVHVLCMDSFDPESIRADERRVRRLLNVPQRTADD